MLADWLLVSESNTLSPGAIPVNYAQMLKPWPLVILSTLGFGLSKYPSKLVAGFPAETERVSGQFSTSALEPFSSLHSWLARPAIAQFNSRYPLAAILRGAWRVSRHNHCVAWKCMAS